MRIANPFAATLGLALGLTLLSPNVRAQSWVRPAANGPGSWFDSANWSGNFVPTGAHHPEINNAGTVQVTQPGAISGGFSLGHFAGESGTLEVSGVGVLGTQGTGTSSETYIGENGTGQLTITAGGKLNAYRVGFGVFAVAAQGYGDIDGTGSQLNVSDDLFVGYNGQGDLSITNGAVVTVNDDVSLGLLTNSSGEVTINNGAFNVPGDQIIVGERGISTLELLNGGTVATNITAIAFFSSAGGSSVTIDNAAWTNTGFFVTGWGANGTLTIQNGGTLQNTDGHVGLNVGSNGTVTVTGANSRWTNTARLFVAGGTTAGTGAGTLNVSNSGLVTASSLLKVWNGNGQVNQLDSARIVVSSDTSLLPTVGGFYVGVGSGTGTVELVGGGKINTTDAYIGRHANSTGTVNVRGANSKWTISDSLFIAGGETNGGTGTLDIQNSGFVAVGSYMKIWNNGEVHLDEAGTGGSTLRVSGDVASPPPAEAGFYVGSSTSIGTVELVGGGDIEIAANAPLARIDGLAGTRVTVDGDGSNWFLPSKLVVGGASHGELKINNAGVTTFGFLPTEEPILTETTIGLAEGSTGLVTVEGAVPGFPNIRSQLIVGPMVVGAAGDGRLDVKAGGLVASTEAIVGGLPSITGGGVVTIDNAQGVFSNLVVGDYGDGELHITGGGKAKVGEPPNPNDGSVSVGRNPSPEQSIITVDGANSELIAEGNLTVGEWSHGTLHITNGAHVENQEGIIGYHAGSNGTVIVDNATWLNQGELSIGLDGTAVLEMRNGGVTAATGTVRIGPSGTVKGTGAVSGTGVTLLVEGIAAPGTSPGTLTVEGNYQQSSTGTLEIELASATSYDVLDITGQATLGGTLEISLLDGFTPSPADTFNFLTAAALSGAFSNINVNSPSGGSFDVDFTPTGLSLSNYQPEELPGDFNEDGSVDAADYVVWRKGLGTIYTPSDFGLWRANFGRTSGAGSSAFQVPEPAGMALTLGALTIFSFAYRLRVVMQVESTSCMQHGRRIASWAAPTSG
jgi:T5SS/PEP-CTERM-associated repeat protein